MNLQQETRNGYTISAEMKKVWAVEMELLNKLLEVCEKHHLRIWAEGGTLLGAVRHHGFIPWDDDIDMAMPREDYDKLRIVAKDEFKAPFFFQCGFTEEYPNGLTKIRKDGTTAILDGEFFQKYHQGVFIDVFPLDSIPDDENELIKFLAKRKKERRKLQMFCYRHFSFLDWKYDLTLLKNMFIIGRVGFNNYFRKYDDFIKQYSKKDASRVSIISWSDHSRYFREKDWYHDTIFLPFEDMMIPVPVGYHKILSQQYGEYMLPTKSPNQHGGFVVLDTEHSYLDYLPSLRRQRKKEIRKSRWDKLLSNNLFKLR